MEFIIIFIFSIMVAIPISIALSVVESQKKVWNFFLLLANSMIGLIGLYYFALSSISPKEKSKPEKPKYELIQEPVYRKIK